MLAYESDAVQRVRTIDVTLVGPLLIYAATRVLKPNWLRVALAVTGVVTIAYNGLRYREVSELNNKSG